MTILVPMSPGELLDRIAILRVKAGRLRSDAARVVVVAMSF